MIVVLLILIGFFLSVFFIKQGSLIERVAYTLLFAATAVPFVVINLSLFGRMYVTRAMLWIVSACFLVLLARSAVSYARAFKPSRPARRDLVVLGIGVGVAVFAWFYFTNTEFLLSLGSYLQRGEAKCFPMQTFRLIEELNPQNPGRTPEFFDIISTPGNALFTTPLMPLFGIYTARLVYVLFQVLLFLFTFLFLQFFTRRYWISLGVALFAVFNPYTLFIEILDRNLMAFALSAALFYTVFAHRDRSFLHGLLFGITSGVGLRFLPLTFIVPILLLYIWEKSNLRAYGLFFFGFILIFPFNIPHLFYHGFTSLGETTPFWTLLWQAVTQWQRTPLMPYPNTIYYLLNLLNFWGLAIGALACYGAFRLVAQDRRRFVFLLLVLLPTSVVLAVQRDWIEGDKARILLTVFLPLTAFIAVAISASIQEIKEKRKMILVHLSLAFIGVVLVTVLMRGVEGRPDLSMEERKPVYQSDAEPYMDFYRDRFGAVGVLPNYHRLCFKTDIGRKRIWEETVAQTFFAPGTPLADNRWVQRWLRPAERKPITRKEFTDRFANLSIDLEKLVTGMDDAVHVLGTSEDVFVNVEKEKDLLDIYHKEVKVSWQPEILPVTVLPRRPEYAALKELNVELNAFIGLGRDEYGFVKVNMVNFFVQPALIEQGKATAMTALPQTDEISEIVLRVPQDVTIVVRNWVVDGRKGVPHRIDSWKITINEQFEPTVEFFYFEPESYL